MRRGPESPSRRPHRRLPLQRALLAACVTLLVACGTTPPRTPSSAPTAPAAKGAPPPSASSKYYKDDGPGEAPPPNLDQVPDAVPRLEPLHRFANRPYTVLGQDYVPATSLRPYRQRGIASWYGRKFHGQKTSIGETYDMYGMTAAHPTLPIPSYARVTNVATGKSVVVRVNDRGPFLHGRLIDLSYAAAYKLGISGKGSGEVEVEAIIPGDSPTLTAAAPLPPVAVAPDTAPTTIALPPTPAAPTTGGFAVQLGAFQNNQNAQNFLTHVQAQLASAQVTPRVREVNGLYRVYVGPYADREEAKRVADRITQAFGMAAAVAPH
ncbi:MAG: septal ring lytic transglycosylase RlpA family protein [Burkholderiales bacterium]